MRYLAGFTMFAFILLGLGLAAAAVRELIVKLTRLVYFRRAAGRVVRIETQRQFQSPGGLRHLKPHYRFFPVIEFRHLSGGAVVFQSATGDGGTKSRYRVGQRVAVVYDIDDRVPPMINSFAGVWLPVVLQLFGGLVFAAAGAMICFAFGAKIFGRG